MFSFIWHDVATRILYFFIVSFLFCFVVLSMLWACFFVVVVFFISDLFLIEEWVALRRVSVSIRD